MSDEKETDYLDIHDDFRKNLIKFLSKPHLNKYQWTALGAKIAAHHIKMFGKSAIDHFENHTFESLSEEIEREEYSIDRIIH